MKRSGITKIIMTGLLVLMSALGNIGCARSSTRETLRIAIPESAYVQDPDSNYYVKWLSEKTNTDLQITLIRQERSTDYLDALFSSDADIDVVMFGESFQITEDELQDYIDSKDIYVQDKKSFYENTGSSKREGVGQILWINYNWLKNCSLSIPQNTRELETVLKAFRDEDPNGNGLKDEIPLAGSSDGYVYSPVEFILNSYVYNDPYHSRFGVNEESDVLNARSDAFREGLKFCHALYEEGLLDESIFEGNITMLRELCNSDADMVGGFTTDSISDVIYQGNPEILARFIHVLPLEGEGKERNALYYEASPSIGAIITQRSTKKDSAVRLLELMMTPEASLIARYGEEGVDWEYSDGSDVSVYGGPSTVTTINYIWDVSQNKHMNGIGPMNVPDEYLLGVTWNGVNSDSEYINQRARMSYEDYLKDVYRLHPYDERLSGYIDEAVKDFARGNKDIGDDEEWERFIKGLPY